MCPKMELNPPSNPSFLQLSTGEYQKIAVYRYLSFLVIFIGVYSPILAPILIQIAYAVNTDTQFNMSGKQSYANDCSS